MTIRRSPSWPIGLAFLAAAFFFYAERGAHTQFSQNSYVGNAAGTANAIALMIPNVGSYSDIVSQPIFFTAQSGNTGATTINVNGLGAINLTRPTPAGPFSVGALGGGEILSGQLISVLWDGAAQFQIQNSALPMLPGTVIDYGGTSCPTGFFAANGQTPVAEDNVPLFTVLGGTWGAVGPGFFTLPDLRGRTTFGQDQNVGGFSNRITVAGGNFNGQTVGASGANQNIALGVNEIPVITSGGTVSPFTPTINPFTPVVNITPFTPVVNITPFTPAVNITPFTVSGNVDMTSIVSGALSVSMTAGNFGVKVVSGSTYSTAGGIGIGTGDLLSITSVTDNRVISFNSSTVSPSGSSNSITPTATANAITPTATANAVTPTSNSITPTFNGAVFNSGGGQAHSTLSPGAIISKCIRA